MQSIYTNNGLQANTASPANPVSFITNTPSSPLPSVAALTFIFSSLRAPSERGVSLLREDTHRWLWYVGHKLTCCIRLQFSTIRVGLCDRTVPTITSLTVFRYNGMCGGWCLPLRRTGLLLSANNCRAPCPLGAPLSTSPPPAGPSAPLPESFSGGPSPFNTPSPPGK